MACVPLNCCEVYKLCTIVSCIILIKRNLVMKNILLIAIIIATTNSLFSMEIVPKVHMRDRDLDTCNQPFITIINELPTEDTHLSHKKIYVTDNIRNISYQNKSYSSDPSYLGIKPGHGLRFSPCTNTQVAEYTRLGMNDQNNAALIQFYIPAAIKNRLLQLYIGEHSTIKFNDTIRFKLESDGTITLNHNNKRLKTIKTQCITKIIGAPKDSNTRNLEPLLLVFSNEK